MEEIQKLTLEQICEMAKMAVGDWVYYGGEKKEDYIDHSAVDQEYRKKIRQISWEENVYGEKIYFKIEASDEKLGWTWVAWKMTYHGEIELLKTLSPAKIVDYLDSIGINCRGKK